MPRAWIHDTIEPYARLAAAVYIQRYGNTTTPTDDTLNDSEKILIKRLADHGFGNVYHISANGALKDLNAYANNEPYDNNVDTERFFHPQNIMRRVIEVCERYSPMYDYLIRGLTTLESDDTEGDTESETDNIGGLDAILGTTVDSDSDSDY